MALQDELASVLVPLSMLLAAACTFCCQLTLGAYCFKKPVLAAFALCKFSSTLHMVPMHMQQSGKELNSSRTHHTGRQPFFLFFCSAEHHASSACLITGWHSHGQKDLSRWQMNSSLDVGLAGGQQ